MVWTARSNFIQEVASGDYHCRVCGRSLQGEMCLTYKFPDKKGKKLVPIALCNDECWQTYDHNYWIKQAVKRGRGGVDDEYIKTPRYYNPGNKE